MEALIQVAMVIMLLLTVRIISSLRLSCRAELPSLKPTSIYNVNFKDPGSGGFFEFSVTLMNLPSALLKLVSSAEQTCVDIGKLPKKQK